MEAVKNWCIVSYLLMELLNGSIESIIPQSIIYPGLDVCH